MKFILLALALVVVVAEDDLQNLRKEMHEMNLRSTSKIDRLEQELRDVRSELYGGIIFTSFFFFISIIFLKCNRLFCDCFKPLKPSILVRVW